LSKDYEQKTTPLQRAYALAILEVSQNKLHLPKDKHKRSRDHFAWHCVRQLTQQLFP